MADALVGATAQIALEKLLSFATDQIGMVKEFNKDLESLRETVEMISGLLVDAERKRLESSAVNVWLKSLETLAFRAEHVLDEVNYEMLRRTANNNESFISARISTLVSFFSSHNKIVFRFRMAPKLKDINIGFKLINEKATGLGLQYSQLTVVPQSNTGSSREKVSVVDEKVIGRGKEEKAIVHELLSKSNELLTSIPIVGIGGLGKTTLAQSVYNNKQVVEHFGQRIWIWIPPHCVPKDIFKLILPSLKKNSGDIDNKSLEDVVKEIKEELKDKRYLLVLDNVWSGHSEFSWGEFLGSLSGISTLKGNYIVLTTREASVASIFCPRRDGHFSLEKLSDKDCLDIVKERALTHEESIQYFEAIREKIIEICQGVPLVARVIGGLLGRIPTRDWCSLLHKGISNMTRNEKDEYNVIKQILHLSFDHLNSPSLKKCFTYCSLFEKGSKMQKKQLIQLWMAEGFLQPKPGDDDMEIGNDYINSLLGSSLLQEVIDEEGECKCIRMHDLVHDLAQSVSNPMKDLKDVKEEDRYLVIDSFGEENRTFPKMRMLRTLFLGSGICDNMLVTSFKHLHVLKLSCVVSHELPSSICKLIHLRYLGVSDPTIRAIPESISKLYNLQTLRIEKCFDLRALPKGMTKLFNLRHLHCSSYMSLPPKIGRLTNLQTLEHFVISEKNQIKELGCLKNLRGKLNMYNLDGVSSKEEAQQAGLNRKPMNHLSFYWRREDVNHEDVMEGLQPHPHLQKLEIDSFLGNQFPSWFMVPGLSQRLDRLVSLSFNSCKRCKQLPTLGQLPSLEYLKLHELDNICCIEPSFYGIGVRSGSRNDIVSGQGPRKIFPALRHLEVVSMKNLKEWMEYQTTNSEVVEMFPNLQELEIDDCPQLSHAPIHYFQRLKYLEIKSTGLTRIFSTVEKDQICSRSPNSTPLQAAIPTSLDSLEIRNCDNLSELPEYLYELQSLRHLDICFCSNLKSLPIPMGHQRLTSLQKLIICGCDGLTSLPHELLNSCASLTHLHIVQCDGLTSLHADLLNSCVSLQHLDISHLRNLESVPFDLQQTPSLSSLSLYGLPKLVNAPKLSSYSSRLSDLRIGEFSNSVEFDWSSLSLRKLDLREWPNLVSLPDQLQHLTALTELSLRELGQIEALPDWFANLVSLENLFLYGCEKLCYLPSMRSLTKLKFLSIQDCPLLKERCSQRNGPDSEWAKISHIPKIRIFGEPYRLG